MSVRRHWAVALVVLLLVPIVMGVFLAGREVVRPPARYTISADVLIPGRDESGADPENVPPVLLQGQTDLALAPETKLTAIEEAGLDPAEDNGLNLDARQSEDFTVMTLQVAAPTAEIASNVLDGYIFAYEEARRESVRDAALDLQDIQKRTVRVLERQIKEVEATLRGNGVALPPQVPATDPVAVPAGTSSADTLSAYERNALLNERQLRQIDYALQSTRTQIPGKFAVTVQRRATSRVTPPPPSPLIPLLQILGVGILLALVIPVAMDRLDSTITEARGAPGALRAGVLTTIPSLPRRHRRRLAPAGSSWDLAFRSLAATSISTDRLPKAIMVTSPAGSTQDYVAANFAAGLAGLGVSVALIGTVPHQSWFLRDAEDGIDEELDPDEPTMVGSALPSGRPSTDSGLGTRPDGPPTFPELLQDAQAGRLVGDFRPRLARRDRDNLYIIPPGEEVTELSLDGLPPLLDALSRSAIDVVVIAGPAYVRDPNATIIAWSTRHVLWAVELGQVEKADAQLAADQLELAGVEPFGIALVKRHARRS